MARDSADWLIRLSPTTLSIPYDVFPAEAKGNNAWAGMVGPDMEAPQVDWAGWWRARLRQEAARRALNGFRPA